MANIIKIKEKYADDPNVDIVLRLHDEDYELVLNGIPENIWGDADYFYGNNPADYVELEDELEELIGY